MLNRRDEMYFDFLVKIPEDTGKISLNRRILTSDVFDTQ